MALFEQLKLFPKIDLHIDFLGSVTKDSINLLTNNRLTEQEIEEAVVVSSLKDYFSCKKLTSSILNSLDNISDATSGLIEKLKKDNIIYSEIFLDLTLFKKELNKEDILLTILKEFKKQEFNANLVLIINSNISKEDIYEIMNLVYKYYHKGLTGVSFIKGKQESLDTYQAFFSKLIKDKIDYIVVLDSKITNQNKEIYYHAKRIIYNVLEYPDDVFLNIIKENNILLEFPITYQSYFNIYDSLNHHIIYDLYKNNINILITTIDITTLDTDLLNEYCKLFNVFPFNLHDLINILTNNINNLNINDDLKNKLINDFKEKANELL